MENIIKINCDGGARGNPGPAASAFVVRFQGKIIYKGSIFLGKTTNNVAEYNGAILALKWIAENQQKVEDKDILFLLDSELVTKQLIGLYKVKDAKLRRLLESAKLLELKIKNKINYHLISRENNKDADLLVNETLDNFKKNFT